MVDRLVLAVDCSTTAAKAVVVDGSGTVVASGSCPLDLDRPGPGLHEQDAGQWWTSTRTAIREAVTALRAGGRDAADLRAIGLTHQRESFVCADADGRPLRPAICWLDSRAGKEIAELGSPHVHATSGKQPDVTPALYKIAWLDRQEPAALRAAAVVADVHAVLAHRLTGRWATSLASGDSLGLLDLRAGVWSSQLLALAGLRRDQVPSLVEPGTPVGPLLPDVAADLGLPAAVPLVAGMGDGQAAGLGAHVTDGIAYVNLGTSLVCGVGSERYLTGAGFRTLAGAPAGSFVLETVLNAASYLTSWFRTELGDPAQHGAVDPALEAAASAVPPGAEGLLTVPYWNCAQTPYWDADARGVMLGWTGRHTRAHAYRSLLEGVAFELRLHLDGLETATAQPLSTLRLMGGGSRSPLWRQIVADVTGRRVELCDGEEISARGAAVLAWAASSPEQRLPLERRIDQAARAMHRVALTVEPDPRTEDAYAAVFAVQQRIYPALRDVFGALAGLSGD